MFHLGHFTSSVPVVGYFAPVRGWGPTCRAVQSRGGSWLRVCGSWSQRLDNPVCSFSIVSCLTRMVLRWVYVAVQLGYVNGALLVG